MREVSEKEVGEERKREINLLIIHDKNKVPNSCLNSGCPGFSY